MDCFLGGDGVTRQVTFNGKCEELLTSRMELGKFQGRVDRERWRFKAVVVEEEGSRGFEGGGEDIGCTGGNRERCYFGGVRLTGISLGFEGGYMECAFNSVVIDTVCFDQIFFCVFGRGG